MNPYTARTQARIQPRDMTIATLTDPHIAAISLTLLERRRGWQAETEMAWLLKQHGVQPASVSSRVAMLRQAIGSTLICAGQRLVGASQRAVVSEPVSSSGRLGTAG